MLSFIKISSVICALSLIGSCSIPEVETPKKSDLILASDFLFPKDSILFQNFEKQQNIKVKIKHLTTDSIISHYLKYQYNSKFDGVLLYSSYSLNRLSKTKILHPLSPKLSDSPKGLKSPNSDWIVFGLDPYVIDFGKEKTANFTYNEFANDLKWQPILTKDESAAFFASVLHQFGRNNMYKSMNWLRTMKDQMSNGSNDTLAKENFTLSRFSISQQAHNNNVISNQGRLGTFYDGIGIGSVKHSAKYSEITRLQLYVMKSFNNQAITGKLFVFPIEDPNLHSDFKYQNDYPAFFRCTPNEAAKEYRDMERILNKLDMKLPMTTQRSTLLKQPNKKED